MRVGHVFEVQPSLATPGKAQTPDYVFYRDEEALQENKGKMLNEALLAAKAYSVGDAKSWERSLDRALRTDGKDRDLLSNKNPSYQIALLLGGRRTVARRTGGHHQTVFTRPMSRQDDRSSVVSGSSSSWIPRHPA